MSAAFHVVIPARYGSSRLPGKPLRLLAGKPMIEHVWLRGVEAGAASVSVATDDERIRSTVEGFGGTAWMTSPAHRSGTDRLAEVAARAGWVDEAIVVNLQGDEPCMPSSAIRAVAELLASRPELGIATCATPIRTAEELFAPSVVKVILDDAGLARWFTRAPVPWARDSFRPGIVPNELPAGVPYLRHLGLYAYRVAVLRKLCQSPAHAHELAESLEQLRALCLGVSIGVALLDAAPGPGVDTEADLERAAGALGALRGAP